MRANPLAPWLCEKLYVHVAGREYVGPGVEGPHFITTAPVWYRNDAQVEFHRIFSTPVVVHVVALRCLSEPRPLEDMHLPPIHVGKGQGFGTVVTLQEESRKRLHDLYVPSPRAVEVALTDLRKAMKAVR